MPFSPDTLSAASWRSVEAARTKLGLPNADALYQRLERATLDMQLMIDERSSHRLRLTLPWPEGEDGHWYVCTSLPSSSGASSITSWVRLEEVLRASPTIVDGIVAAAEAALVPARAATPPQAAEPGKAAPRSPRPPAPAREPVASRTTSGDLRPATMTSRDPNQFALAI